jgi:hypothetical protein
VPFVSAATIASVTNTTDCHADPTVAVFEFPLYEDEPCVTRTHDGAAYSFTYACNTTTGTATIEIYEEETGVCFLPAGSPLPPANATFVSINGVCSSPVIFLDEEWTAIATQCTDGTHSVSSSSSSSSSTGTSDGNNAAASLSVSAGLLTVLAGLAGLARVTL